MLDREARELHVAHLCIHCTCTYKSSTAQTTLVLAKCEGRPQANSAQSVPPTHEHVTNVGQRVTRHEHVTSHCCYCNCTSAPNSKLTATSTNLVTVHIESETVPWCRGRDPSLPAPWSARRSTSPASPASRACRPDSSRRSSGIASSTPLKTDTDTSLLDNIHLRVCVSNGRNAIPRAGQSWPIICSALTNAV